MRSKIKTKLAVFSVIVLLTSSCNEDEPIPTPEPIKPTLFEYVYTGKHDTKDFNIYVGPKGEKQDIDNEFARNFWEHSIGESPCDTLIIDLMKDSLHLKYNKTVRDFPLKLSNDTLWYTDNQYWGIFLNKEMILINKAFYFINHKGKQIEGSDFWIGGHRGNWQTYEKARIDRFFYDNSTFQSLADMVAESDTVAWLTEYYEFKLVKKY